MDKYFDRITEAYYGLLDEGIKENSRQRVDWICDNTAGKTVLDIGCSQGICPILLGRRGLQVTGVDIAEESICYARSALANESSEVQTRVNFICGDFLKTSFDGKYDTVILGEILEHLESDLLNDFINKASDYMHNESRIIITVPFGINDHRDHKRTYYFADIFTFINSSFAVIDVKFFGRWIGLIGKKKSADIKDLIINPEIILEEEQQFYKIEKMLRDDLKADKITIKKTLKEKEKYITENDYLKKEILKVTAYNQEIEKQKIILNDKIREIQGINKKYMLLANSKLGRLTLWYWPKKDKLQLLEERTVEHVKDAAKKIPGLHKTVRKLKTVIFGKPPAGEPVPMPLAPAKSRAKADEGYFDRVAPLICDMPESNGGRYYQKLNTRIGVICDRFYYDSVYAAADFVYLSPEDWEEKIEGLDFLLMVSTWHGLNDDEWGGSAEDKPKRQLQYQIIETCRQKCIPTVFYSKEDPVNYSYFLGVAQKCDVVFTTAEECIPNYVRDCGHDRVHLLCFGINPVFHNPVGFRHAGKKRDVVFSGSWMIKYPDRMTELQVLFNGVLQSPYGLKIIDRNYYYTKSNYYAFPDKYRPFSSPPIDHQELQKVHKLYDWAININSIKTSATMFANRIYELQAAGNLMISNYSVGVNSRFPTVFMAHTEEEVGHILRGFTSDEVYERQVTGVRRVMTNETCFDRVAELIERIGLKASRNVRRVAVLADELTPGVRTDFDRQTYPDRTLFAASDVNDILLREFDIVAFFAEGAEYGAFYLEDMINGFKYTDSDYITKDAYLSGGDLCPGREHDYVSVMKDKYRTVFWRESFTAEELLAMNGETALENGYSIDRFNFNSRPATEKASGEFKLTVIVPVYNNGWHLYGKAFASLRRSTMFEDMEIILVDDGSTDGFTLKLEEYLADCYSNVRLFSFGDGGSGSASRPRNKGVELAMTEYITYLDPDNEAVCDGYARLYQQAVKEDLDLAVGNMVICRQTVALQNYYDTFSTQYGSDQTDGDKDLFFQKIRFRPMSIQAMVIKKCLITNSGIKQVEGAAGQDSLFSWQLMENARRIKAVPWTIHLYYAATEGSVVNAVGPSFFRKLQKLMPDLIAWLNSKSLMDAYMDIRYNRYTKDWIFAKLALVRSDAGGNCAEIIYDMLKMFDDYYDKNDPVINQFMQMCDIRDFQGAYEFILSKKAD